MPNVVVAVDALGARQRSQHRFWPRCASQHAGARLATTSVPLSSTVPCSKPLRLFFRSLKCLDCTQRR